MEGGDRRPAQRRQEPAVQRPGRFRSRDRRSRARRDTGLVSFRTAFSGWPVELCDTAGERETDDAVERLGIARSRREKEDADLVLLVLDRSEPLQTVDRICWSQHLSYRGGQ